MKKFFFLITVLGLLLSSCDDPNAHKPKVTYLMWKYQQADTGTTWHFAIVPGSIHISLQKDTIIKNLDKEAISGKANIYSDKKWIYKSNIYVTKDMKKEQAFLVFESLDLYAYIYLNNKLLCKTNDFFKTYKFDVTDLLKIGNNTVKVVFYPTKSYAKNFYESLSFKIPDNFVGIMRKPLFQITKQRGYAYNTLGMSLPAYVVFWDKLYIDDVQIYTEEITDSSAILNFNIKLYSSKETSGKIKISTQYGNVLSNKVNFKAGEQNLNYKIEIRNPKLWHPKGYGDQHLYKFTIELYSGNKITESEKVKYGIKNLKISTENNKLTVYDGDKKIFLKVAEINPEDINVGIAKYGDLLNSLDLSGFNCVTFWEQGYYPKDEFYSICDQKGIMVIQPFMLPVKAFPAVDTISKIIADEAQDRIQKLNNHVCLLMWTGNNNNNYLEKIKSYPSLRKKEITAYNFLIFDKILPGLVASYGKNSTYNETFNFDNLIYIDNKTVSLPSEYTLNKAGITDVNFSENLLQEITFPKSQYGRLKANIQNYDANNKKSKAIYLSQVTQAKDIENSLRKNLFRSGQNKDGIVFRWVNDYSRVISPATIDKDGFWKAGQYVLKDVMGDFFIDMESNKNVVTTSIRTQLDTPKVLIYYKLYNFDGKLLWQRVENTVLDKKLQRKFDIGLFLNIFKKNFVVFKTEIYHNQELAAEKYHYFVPEQQLKLKKANIEKHFYKIDKGYALELTSDYMAQKVHIVTTDKNIIIDKNFIDILPGESKIIILHTNRVIPDIKNKIKVYSMYDYLTNSTDEKTKAKNKNKK